MLALTAFSLVLKLVGSQSVESGGGGRPSTEREKAEGPGVMAREVLGGKPRPSVCSIQLYVPQDSIKHFRIKKSAYWIRAWHCHEAQATAPLYMILGGPG